MRNRRANRHTAVTSGIASSVPSCMTTRIGGAIAFGKPLVPRKTSASHGDTASTGPTRPAATRNTTTPAAPDRQEALVLVGDVGEGLVLAGGRLEVGAVRALGLLRARNIDVRARVVTPAPS